MIFKKYYIVFILLFFNLTLKAQDVIKSNEANQYWLTTDVNYVIDDIQTLKYQGEYRSLESISGDRNLRWHQRIGYAFKLTAHWEVEGAVRYVVDQTLEQNEWYFQGMLRHIGKIGSLDFIKFVSYEQVKFTGYENVGAGSIVDSYGRTSVSTLLGKDFKIKNLPLRAEFDYTFFNYWGDAKHETARIIDRGRASLTLLASVTPSLQIGTFLTRQVDYSPLFLGGSYPQLDENGFPVLDDNGDPIIIDQEDYYMNDISTIWGMKLIYTFKKKES